MLRIENLGKRHGDHLVFQGLTRVFGPGCYALCEEDSTGKSTLLSLVAGVMAPDTGDIWIDGYSMSQSPLQAKGRLAYAPADCMASPALTGRGLLEQVAAEKNAAIDEDTLNLAHALGLEAHLDKPFEQMSTGTRRKVYLAAAALGDPVVIVADGPSDGLDAPARAVLAEQFRLWARDRVVLFASHDPQLVQACGANRLDIADLQG